MNIPTDEISQSDLTRASSSAASNKSETVLARVNRARKTVLFVCVLLIASQIMLLLFGLLGFAVGVVGAIFTLLVSWYATRKARQGAKSTIWFMLPPVVFSGIPLILHLMPLSQSGFPSMQEMLLASLPFVFGFLIPVIVLLILYWRLARLAGLIEKNRNQDSI